MTGFYAVGPGRILGKTKVFMHLNLKCALNAFAVNATHVVRNETLSCLYSGCRQWLHLQRKGKIPLAW